MDRTIKILICGVVFGFITIAVGYAGLQRSKARVSALVEQCKTENAHSSVPPNDPLAGAQFICDPVELRNPSLTSELVGIQSQLVKAQVEGESWFEKSITLAVGIVLLFGAPYAWYFLLRRIRELRNAIAGK